MKLLCLGFIVGRKRSKLRRKPNSDKGGRENRGLRAEGPQPSHSECGPENTDIAREFAGNAESFV